MAKVTVRYQINQQGQKELIKRGQDAKYDQSIILDDAENKLIDVSQVDSDGNLSIDLTAHTREWVVSKDAIFNNPELPHFFIDVEHEWVYRHTFRVIPQSLLPLNRPIDTIDDVLGIINYYDLTKKQVEVTIPDLDNKDAEYYETQRTKYIEQEKQKANIIEVKRQLKSEYSDSLTKIEAIQSLIEGKTRIRTAQIKTILQ